MSPAAYLQRRYGNRQVGQMLRRLFEPTASMDETATDDEAMLASMPVGPEAGPSAEAAEPVDPLDAPVEHPPVETDDDA